MIVAPGGNRSHALRGRAREALASTWALGVVVALLTWTVRFTLPDISLDPSWWSALYMGAHRGMQFGTEIVFTFGPLGFIHQPWLYFSDLAVIAFLYQGLLHVALAMSVVWALRRSFPVAAAVVVAFLVLVAARDLDVPITLTAIWCLAALAPESPRHARALVVFAGAALGGIETLAQLRTGPIVLAMCLLALLGSGDRRRAVSAFLLTALVTLTALWFASGQALSGVGPFVSHSAAIVAGYSEAMGVPASSDLYLPGAIVIGAALVAAAALTSRTGPARIAAALTIAIAVFSLYKEAIVRNDAGHASFFFASAAAFAVAGAWGTRRAIAAVAIAALTLVALIAAPDPGALDFNPLAHVRDAGHEGRLLFSPGRRTRTALFGAVQMAARYQLPAAQLQLLKGRTVHVDPWEAGIAWVNGLDWDPLPVFQDYSAYTRDLDRLNAAALRSTGGPERILRENTALVDPRYPTPAIDDRVPAWDPPAAALEMLCNYAPLRTTPRWQVLGRRTGRCEAPQRIASVRTSYGKTVAIPPARSGEIVYAEVHGVGVTGIEHLRTLLYKARERHAVINGRVTRRIVPGTAADGLLMGADARADYPPPFALSPGARTLAFQGGDGPLRIDVFRVRVRG